MLNTLVLEPSTEVGFQVLQRAEASRDMSRAVARFERRFSVQFDSLTYFPREALQDLQNEELHLPPSVLDVASRTEQSVISDIEFLSSVANSLNPPMAERKRYYDTLLRIYEKLPFDVSQVLGSPDTLVVAIEREGRVWAEALGCLPEGRSICPHAKRIPFEGGIVVGLTDLSPSRVFRKCVLIDGAIASGATLMAVIDVLHQWVDRFEVFAAHATGQGIRAIYQFAHAKQTPIKLAIGHVTEGLNDHYYAVYPGDAPRLVVGDLGDTISPILP